MFWNGGVSIKGTCSKNRASAISSSRATTCPSCSRAARKSIHALEDAAKHRKEEHQKSVKEYQEQVAKLEEATETKEAEWKRKQEEILRRHADVMVLEDAVRSKQVNALTEALGQAKREVERVKQATDTLELDHAETLTVIKDTHAKEKEAALKTKEEKHEEATALTDSERSKEVNSLDEPLAQSRQEVEQAKQKMAALEQDRIMQLSEIEEKHAEEKEAEWKNKEEEIVSRHAEVVALKDSERSKEVNALTESLEQ